MIGTRFALLSRLALAVFALVALVGMAVAENTARYSDGGPEPMLDRIYDLIESNQLNAALDQSQALINAYPNFRLAYLIKGDLLLARSRPLKTLGDADNAPESKLDGLREEAVARLKGYRDKPPENYLPRYLVQMQPDQKYALRLH